MPAAAEWRMPPILLNHLVVGILLLPLGVLTFFSGRAAASGERWAPVITRTTAVTVATLPVTLFVIMGTRYFEAMPFLVATAITGVVAVATLLAALWPVSSSTPEAGK